LLVKYKEFMPKKKRKGPTFTEEQKLAAKARMDAYWERKHKQEMALVPIRRILDAVYLAGWKQNKAQVINYRADSQMSPAQGEAEIKKLFNEAFSA
jgi:hypothetical protein